MTVERFAVEVLARDGDRFSLKAQSTPGTVCSAGTACCQRQALVRRDARRAPFQIIATGVDGEIGVGDRLWCEVEASPDRMLARACGIPLLGLLCGAMFGYGLSSQLVVETTVVEAATLIGALVGIAMGLVHASRSLIRVPCTLIAADAGQSGTVLAWAFLNPREPHRDVPRCTAEQSSPPRSLD